MSKSSIKLQGDSKKSPDSAMHLLLTPPRCAPRRTSVDALAALRAARASTEVRRGAQRGGVRRRCMAESGDFFESPWSFMLDFDIAFIRFYNRLYQGSKRPWYCRAKVLS